MRKRIDERDVNIVNLSRRRVAQVGVATVSASLVPASALAAREAGADAGRLHRFFTREEHAIADALAEVIIPRDEHSGGARDAGVADDLDAWLASLVPRYPEQARTRRRFRRGLHIIDRLAHRRHGKGFASCQPQEQRDIVAALAAAAERTPEDDDKHDGEKPPIAARFFSSFKGEVIRSYYTSRIGIHDDLGYLGNTYLEDYVGYDPDDDLVLPSQKWGKTQSPGK